MIEMTAIELNQFIIQNPKIILVDVRENWEYNVVSIKDSVHIPISEIQNKMLDFDEDDMSISQSVKERVQQVLDDQEDDEEDLVDPNKKHSAVQGIDF